MKLKIITISLFALMMVFSTLEVSQAALLEFSDTITYHNDVSFYSFVMNSSGPVNIWTDSYQNGVNFDPIVALWDNSGNLIMENDDYSSPVGPGQTAYDSGIQLAALAAGNYMLSLVSWDNYANGIALADGFFYDGETGEPIAIWDWDHGTGYYHMNVQGDVSSVPEPSTLLLLGSGLVGLGYVRRRFKG